jgi:hypothetical protein
MDRNGLAGLEGKRSERKGWECSGMEGNSREKQERHATERGGPGRAELVGMGGIGSDGSGPAGKAGIVQEAIGVALIRMAGPGRNR